MAGPASIARGNVSLEMVLQLSLNPNNGTAISANTSVETTYTLAGILVGDFLEINKPSHLIGLTVGNIRASATNQIAVQWCNITTGNITPVSENYLVTITRYESLPQTPPASIS